MLMYYFVWAFGLLGNHAVNSASQFLEKQQNIRSIEDGLESEAVKLVDDSQLTVVHNNNSFSINDDRRYAFKMDQEETNRNHSDSFSDKRIDFSDGNLSQFPQTTEVIGERSKERSKDFNVMLPILIDSRNDSDFLTTLNSEELQNQTDMYFRRADNDNFNPHNFYEKEQSDMENKNNSAKLETNILSKDEVIDVNARKDPYYSDSFHSKSSFNEDQLDNPFTTLSTEDTEIDFERNEEYIRKASTDLGEFIKRVSITDAMNSSVYDSGTMIDDTFTQNSYENASYNDTFSSVLHNYTHGNNIPNITGLLFGDNDYRYTSEQEMEMFPTFRTNLSKHIIENESKKIQGVSMITESLQLQKVNTLLNESTNLQEKILVADKQGDSEDKNKKFNEYQDEIYISGNNTDAVAAVQFLHYHDKASSEQCFNLVSAHWDYATNLTEENKNKQLKQTFEYSQFHKKAWKNATSFAWKSFNDTLLRRWFKSLSVLGDSALPDEMLNEFNSLIADMENIYSTAKVCSYTSDLVTNKSLLAETKCNLSLEPDITRILIKSRDYDELLYVWKAWRDSAGKPIREKYLRLVELSNEAAKLNGFADAGELWRESYESNSFEKDLGQLWDQLKPLYEHLHAYVRRKLIHQYGIGKIREDGPIPAHLFGNMWSQSWVSLLDITQPFPGKPSVDVTPIMKAKNMSALEMFKISEEFFTSLGLKPMPAEFWKYSLIEKPEDREIICHASAWDFCNGKDYRIKQCTDVTMEDLITVHHEMGHIQYFLQYSRQPTVFRDGANPGFHEAIGDVLALSVSTPMHLQSIGLLEDIADDPEGDLNFLLRTALDKISFLPSGYLIDLWRWRLFSGEIKPQQMNTEWWKLRFKYQGICPPVKRTETDFDPGAKYHVPGNIPYIRYFVSFVIQFQFHKVLCDAAGQTVPLYKCDIYRSKQAGQILTQVMELGSSEHWSEAMKIMTGGVTGKMDAQPIIEYFQPLLSWLKEQNKNETLGWKSDDATSCP